MRSAKQGNHLKTTILVTLVGAAVVFSAPSILVFASWHVRSKKINAEKEEAHVFVGIWVRHGVSQLSVTRIVGSKGMRVAINPV